MASYTATLSLIASYIAKVMDLQMHLQHFYWSSFALIQRLSHKYGKKLHPDFHHSVKMANSETNCSGQSILQA